MHPRPRNHSLVVSVIRKAKHCVDLIACANVEPVDLLPEPGTLQYILGLSNNIPSFVVVCYKPVVISKMNMLCNCLTHEEG